VCKEGVQLEIITHCGSEIVTGNTRRLAKELQQTAGKCGIEAFTAHDGMTFDVKQHQHQPN
jgi:hypothetical protein